MTEAPKNEKRDEVLKRMLSTPPKPHDEQHTKKDKKDAPNDAALDGKAVKPRHQD